MATSEGLDDAARAASPEPLLLSSYIIAEHAQWYMW